MVIGGILQKKDSVKAHAEDELRAKDAERLSKEQFIKKYTGRGKVGNEHEANYILKWELNLKFSTEKEASEFYEKNKNGRFGYKETKNEDTPVKILEQNNKERDLAIKMSEEDFVKKIENTKEYKKMVKESGEPMRSAMWNPRYLWDRYNEGFIINLRGSMDHLDNHLKHLEKEFETKKYFYLGPNVTKEELEKVRKWIKKDDRTFRRSQGEGKSFWQKLTEF
tara:strand:- start:56 stop:724 length:669 start_codon:yes stop_codon:yes gene_type:complete